MNISVSAKQPILIVEDSDDDFEATFRAFQHTNNLANPLYRCENGAEAIDYLSQQGKYAAPGAAPRPGLILLDLNMPGMDGRKVLSKVKSTSEWHSIPIVVLTTSDHSDDIQECYNLGANSYIKKPVELEDFFTAIEKLKEYWFEISALPKGS